MTYIEACAEYAEDMNAKPESANDIMQCGANSVAMEYGVSYADAKGTIRMLYDGSMVGLESKQTHTDQDRDEIENGQHPEPIEYKNTED